MLVPSNATVVSALSTTHCRLMSAKSASERYPVESSVPSPFTKSVESPQVVTNEAASIELVVVEPKSVTDCSVCSSRSVGVYGVHLAQSHFTDWSVVTQVTSTSRRSE